MGKVFPFLFGGTFIEASGVRLMVQTRQTFPFLFGGTFIEGRLTQLTRHVSLGFPFLFGGTFIKDSPRCSPRNLKNYSQLLVGTFNKTDQYPPV